MKLRIKGNSLRLRISPSEMARLMVSGRVEDTIYFGAGDDAKLTYALERARAVQVLSLRHEGPEIAVIIPEADAKKWANGDAIGIYGAAEAGMHRLELAVEKDFACLDKDDADNRDTYTNPNQGAAC